SFFTNNAKILAKKNNVELWDRNKLIQNLIININKNLNNEDKQNIFIEEIQTDFNKCFSCSKQLTQKERDYCLDNINLFNGRTYCYNCQKRYLQNKNI
ncbi:MAG: hypothetical protein ACP5O4_03680, partial [bacterium]